MKWVTYRHRGTSQLRAGLLYHHYIVDLPFLLAQSEPPLSDSEKTKHLPCSLLSFIEEQDQWRNELMSAHESFSKKDEAEWETLMKEAPDAIFPYDPALLAAPLPKPSSVRDSYSFEQHVKTARGKRGLDMIDQWYDFPVFYFSNHQAIVGPEAGVSFPSSSQKWDFELEVAFVIGKSGKNISREKAFEHVFGLTIMNDWSARDIQAEEVKVGLGPAKAKDFATSLGPFIVTPEEWRDRVQGEQIDLQMEAYLNGELISTGNLNQLYWSIPQMIERISQDCMLYPGDVIGTGTVGSGCILEQLDPKWLQPQDVIQLKVERLGVLRNIVNERGGE